jgi:predicted RNA-binding protein with RPS1 domain
MIYYKAGDIIEGTVIQTVPYGVFMIFDHDVHGLLHISEITKNFVYNISKMMPVGTSHRVKVLEVNQNNNFLKVSIKQICDDDLNKIKVDGKIREKVDDDEINFTGLQKEIDSLKKED